MKQYLVSAAVAVVVVVLGLLFFGGKTTVQLGASPGPDRSNTCESINGVKTCYFSTAINTASSTACSFRPWLLAGATSTLEYGFIRVSSSSAAATQIEFGKGTQNATTTTLGKTTFAANTTGLVNASTSLATSGVFGQNDVFNVNMTPTFQLGGICEAVVNY